MLVALPALGVGKSANQSALRRLKTKALGGLQRPMWRRLPKSAAKRSLNTRSGPAAFSGRLKDALFLQRQPLRPANKCPHLETIRSPCMIALLGRGVLPADSSSAPAASVAATSTESSPSTESASSVESPAAAVSATSTIAPATAVATTSTETATHSLCWTVE